MLDRSLVVFFTAGDPSVEKTVDFMLAVDGLADVIELGIPFSDPVADGRIIQRANVRALSAGFRVEDVFQTVSKFRKLSDTKVVLMTYFNPVFRTGIENFVEKCMDSGADGLIVVDLPPDDDFAGDFVDVCRGNGIKTIFIASPNTPDKRLKLVDRMSTGFVYLTSDYGTTGKRDKIGERAFDFLRRAKSICTNPVGVGFGVSRPEHVKSLVNAGADGVIVGSAIVELVERYGENADVHIREIVRNLAGGLK